MGRIRLSQLLSLFVIFSLALWLSGCVGVGSKLVPVGSLPQVTLQAASGTINNGQSTTLSWTSTNATSVTISPSVGTNLPLSGSQVVQPTATTTYTITATGAAGTATATFTITVNGPVIPPPTVTLSANPAAINSGQPTTLSWTSTNAVSVSIAPAINTDELTTLPVNGSAQVIPTATTTYTITATGNTGAVPMTATATATVTVTQVPPTLQLTLNPTNIVSGKSSTLSWSTVNAATLTIVDSANNPITVASPQQGSAIVKPTTTTTYTATATSPGGLTTTQTVTLNVSTLSVTLSANPTSIKVGQSSTLTFSSMNAVKLSIDNNAPAINPPNGTVSVSPTATTVYTITATDAGGLTTTATATVNVDNGMQNIQHIIFFVQENRSFDNYFSKLGGYRANDPFSGQSYGAVGDIDGIPDDTKFFNPDPTGKHINPFHQKALCIDVTSPSWDESHADVDKQSNGTYKMDNFVKVAAQTGGTLDPQGHRAMGYYDQSDLPYYYELATQYATSDRWFAPVLANTIPNRMYLFTATSYGTTYPEAPTPGAYLQKTIFQELRDNNILWRYYYQDDSSFLSQYIAAAEDPNTHTGPLDDMKGNIRPISEYYTLLSGGTVVPSGDTVLPQVVFIERGSSSANTDEHPDSGKNVQYGAAASSNIINALLASKYYATSAFFLTYDEPGGLFDHVPPQAATAPDNQPPSPNGPPGTHVDPGDFMTTSMRVPFILISPYAKPHFVSHTVRDNTAILKFIEDRFTLPSLTMRDAAQPDLLEFFDFSQPSLLTPPKLPVQPGPTDPHANCNQNLEAGP